MKINTHYCGRNVHDLYSVGQFHANKPNGANGFLDIVIASVHKTKMVTFGSIGSLPTKEEVIKQVNLRYDELFHYDDNGARQALVCTICDEILFREKDVTYLSVDVLRSKRELIAWKNHFKKSERVIALEQKFVIPDYSLTLLKDVSWLNGLAVSPRGTIGRKKNDNRSPYGFSCCANCKQMLLKNQTPLFAIANRNNVGHAPTELTDLTAVELSLLTPVKGYGYCFSYVGGVNMNLRGTMTFMQVKESSIGRATAQLSGMGLEGTVVILLSGKMTDAQRTKACKSIRVDKILAAAKWLCENHRDWKTVPFDTLKAELENFTPCVVDKSKTVTGENSNIETQELFACYFPDGNMDERKGGFENHDDFKTYVHGMQEKNYNMNLNIDLAAEFVKGSEAERLRSACLLQFPYGVGDLNETRLAEDDSYTEKIDLEKYLNHLTKLSQPIFQKPMFQLICYSMISKVRLLKKSKLHVRGEHTASALANDLNSADLKAAIHAKSQGQRDGGTLAAKTLLKAVDACSKALPHSNEASKAARSNGESMQHHFGTGSVWLTVTFDDDNSLVMQVLSDNRVDDDRNASTLTPEELGERRDKRSAIRLEFPGFAAIHFEMLLTIVVEEVIGWDMKCNKSTGKAGFFGICEALAIAFEEQGRRSIHGHMTIYVRGVREIQNAAFFGNYNDKKRAMNILARYHEHVVTTSLFSSESRNSSSRQHKRHEMSRAFDHVCTVVDQRQRQLPTVVSDQCLRNLRHKHGYESTKGKFASCPHCTQTWTYEDMVNQYVRQFGSIDKTFRDVTTRKSESDVALSIIPRSRLLADVIEYQKNVGSQGDERTSMCINAVYNHHFSFHTKGCFKCNKKDKKTHTCGPTCECRMRYPDRARKSSSLKYHSQGKPWFTWNGEEVQQPLVEILPKRGTYDLFQNTSCSAISESKLACNTNAAVITDGPIGQYMFKYQHKQTQKDDVADYEHVERAIKNLSGRRHDDDQKEAVRLVCRAAFAHNSKNVIGAPLASFLIRNGSRFYFSHKFEYCPLKDLRRLLRNQSVPAIARFVSGEVFFENQALHYLCRPAVLNDLSAKEFYENYTTVPKPKKRKHGAPVLTYISKTKYFQHCSARTQKNGKITPATLAAKEREHRTYVKVPQWEFPDTASFKSCILTCEESDVNVLMEKYAEVVLILFMPFRSIHDFIDGTNKNHKFPFVTKFRDVYASDMMKKLEKTPTSPVVVFSDENLRFLQNIQNAAYNSMRYRIPNDDLQSETCPFQNSDVCVPCGTETESDSEEENDDGICYENLMDEMESIAVTDDDSAYLPSELQNFSFGTTRNKGRSKCGYNVDLPVPVVPQERTSGFNSDYIVSYDIVQTQSADTDSNICLDEISYHVKDVVELMFSKSIPVSRKSVFPYNEHAEVTDANGSISSIVEWGNAAQLDQRQRRAFEIIICSFIYTFFDNAKNDGLKLDLDRLVLLRHRRYKGVLQQIMGQESGQIVCLLLGPGGSGKSTVINLVVSYAREYCEKLGHPFTSRTIVVTAMSGIAATLLHGETTHKALGLNRKSISGSMINEWWDTRLLIVDEISFACGKDIEKMQTNCKILKQRSFQTYGNLNVVFSGDFSQLEPVGRSPLYRERHCAEFHQHVNTFIELDGHHRFRDDVDWGNMMQRFREGEPTLEDVECVNDRCLVSDDHRPPGTAQIATFFNRDRDAINCGIYERLLEKIRGTSGKTFTKDAVLIFMDTLSMRDSKNTYATINSNGMKKWFYSNCGENSCKMNEHQAGRVDPVLKLYAGCPLMLTQNKDVASGQANGSRVFFQKIHMKRGETGFKIRMKNGTILRAFFASQVKHITVQHESTDIVPNEFDVCAEDFTFKADWNLNDDKKMVDMKGRQFALISNSATTGHKLQGYTAKTLVVVDWVYSGNWAYTVLSRVRTIGGLYLLKPLSMDLSKYEMAPEIEDMLTRFRDALPLRYFSSTEYDRMIERTTT